MKKIVEQVRKKITFCKFFIGATLFGIIVLSFSVGINYKYTKDMTNVLDQRLVKIEEQVRNINPKNENKSILKNIEQEKDDFIKQYYTIQADWLNKWLATLAIIMAVLGIMIPFCFIKFLENKEKEMDRIIKETSEQKDSMQLQVGEVNEKYNEIKKHVNEMRAIAKYNEGLNKMRIAKNDKLIQEEAFQLYLEANELDPKNPDILYVIGNYYGAERKIDKGIEYLNNAIDILPKAQYYQDLFLLYYDCKRYQNALEVADLSIQAKDTTPLIKTKAYSIKALIYSNSQDKDFTINNINNALQQNKLSYATYNQLALAYININEYRKAISLLEQNNDIYPDNKSYYNLVEAYLYDNNFEKAINLIKINKKDKNSSFTFIYKDDYKKWLSLLNKVYPQTEATIKIKEFIEQIEKKERE